MDVYPSLTYHDVDAALEFLTTAFGLETISAWRDDDGTVQWTELAHGPGVCSCSPTFPTTGTPPTSAEDGSTWPSPIATVTTSAPESAWSARAAAPQHGVGLTVGRVGGSGDNSVVGNRGG